MRRREDRGLAVPTGRLNRMARLGSLGTALAGSVAVGGVRAMASGRRPRLDELLLTPANAARVADQLSRMRGAAMKVGQLLSMEARDVLPDDLALILERLRKDARFMPPAQLKTVLAANWGSDFMRRFVRFDVRPIAAASIGQVHRAQTHDGRDLAIKVQYPGIRASIDSDIGNLGMILKGARLLPDARDIDRLLGDARAQLHEEADYSREADAQARFATALAGQDAFLVPRVHRDLCTADILATDYIVSEPIESAAEKGPDVRDRVANRLLVLLLHELFVLGDMQTDPNFANYRYQPETDRIVLLDFGATRRFAPEFVAACRRLLQAGVAGDGALALGIMGEIGLTAPALPERDRAMLLALFDMAAEPLRAGGVFDPARSDLLARLRAAGLRLAGEQEAVHVPPADTLLLQRKVLGSYLLAERLRARIDMDALLAPYLGSESVADTAARAGAR